MTEAFQTIGAAIGILASAVAVVRWLMRRRTAGPGLIAMLQSMRYDAATARSIGGGASDFYLDRARQDRIEALKFEAKALANSDASAKILAAVDEWERAFAVAGPADRNEPRDPDLVQRQKDALDKVDKYCGEALEALADTQRHAK